MFDLDPGKLIVIGIVALIAIPSKDLPRVLRQLGQVAGRARRMAAEFQAQFAEAMREAELDDIKKEMAEIKEGVKLGGAFDPFGEARKQIGAAVETRPMDREPPGSQERGEPEGSRSESGAPPSGDASA
jgi:sec-independent protein translocase protein TatB